MSALRRSYRQNLVGLVLTGCVMFLLGVTITNSFYLTTLIFSLISAIAGIGLTLVFGFAGLASLGQAAFLGIGAYVAAGLTEFFGLPPLLSLMAAIAVSAGMAWFVGRPLLRLSGVYLTMASLAFGLIAFLSFSQARRYTGGLDPGFMLSHGFSVGGMQLDGTKSMYWVCCLFTIVALFVAINLVHSRFGRALRALRSSEPASEGVGIPTVAYKSLVFAIGGGMAGLSGALYAFFMRSFNATAFNFTLSIELLVIVMVGSLRSIWGALFGAVFVTLLPAVLENLDDIKLFMYGIIIVAIMMFMPDGLFDGVFRASSRLLRRKVSS
jgi:branched-chain amino acid transport system permease protein